jgi:hypothetical protein
VDALFRKRDPLISVVRVERKYLAHGQNDANDRAPRGRELSVREGLTRINVDWSGSWQAARPGNWLGRSPATKAALGPPKFTFVHFARNEIPTSA